MFSSVLTSRWMVGWGSSARAANSPNAIDEPALAMISSNSNARWTDWTPPLISSAIIALPIAGAHPHPAIPPSDRSVSQHEAEYRAKRHDSGGKPLDDR